MSINFKGKKFKVKEKIVNISYQNIKIKILNLQKKKIDSFSNLIGIENLPDLEALYLDDNQLSEIQMIPNLKNLKLLSLKNNKIHEIKNLEGFPNLKVLHLTSNKITEINNLECLQNLEFLYLNNNQITEIKNLENLKHLFLLNLNTNQITEVKNLDKVRSLRKLYLKDNQITRIFPIHLHLEEINIYGNPFHTYLKSRFADLSVQKIIEYSIDPEGLEKRLKVGMSNIHVPLDYSSLTEIISHNEDILYSSLCNVTEKRINGKSYWKSHILITESGLAITVPQGGGSVGGKYFKWSDIREVRSKKNDGSVLLMRGPDDINALIITMSRDIDFESRESFSNRLNSFPDFCISLWEDYRNKYKSEK